MMHKVHKLLTGRKTACGIKLVWNDGAAFDQHAPGATPLRVNKYDHAATCLRCKRRLSK